MLLYPRSKGRPFHLGPFPLEALPRDDGAVAIGASRSPKATSPGVVAGLDDALSRVADHYRQIFSKFVEGTPAKGKAPVPDDLERRSADVKGGAYFMDASCVGVCRIPQNGWIAEA